MVGSSVCTPGRPALNDRSLPGPQRMTQVLIPKSTGGLLPEVTGVTIPPLPRAYSTACIGKWHLVPARPNTCRPTTLRTTLFRHAVLSLQKPWAHLRTPRSTAPAHPSSANFESHTMEPDQSQLTEDVHGKS